MLLGIFICVAVDAIDAIAVNAVVTVVATTTVLNTFTTKLKQRTSPD